jgi:hypothetical protein
MTMPPRNLPRFLPTLTEVVRPSELAAAQAAATPEFEALSHTVLQSVEGVLENRLLLETSALVSSTVAAQMQVLRANLRQELEVIVKQAVVEAMRSKPVAH